MNPIYRKVVDEMFDGIVNEGNRQATREQLATAMAKHLEYYFKPRVDEVEIKREADAKKMELFRRIISNKE